MNCPFLTDTKVRRTLNLSIVKLQLCYATPVWSPFHNRKLSENIESVQRRATAWVDFKNQDWRLTHNDCWH
jgi:hypothetical protein